MGLLLACGDQVLPATPALAQYASVGEDSSPPGSQDDADHVPDAEAPNANILYASTPKVQETTNALCSNGMDDARNGHVDCEDFESPRSPSVTACNTEFNQPLPAPTMNAKPIELNEVE